MRLNMTSVGIYPMLAGAVIYALGIMLTPGQPCYAYEELNATKRIFNIGVLLWPHSSPKFNPLVPAGFHIAILGAALGILGISISKLRESRK